MCPFSRHYGNMVLLLQSLLILIVEQNYFSIITEHSTYSAIMYYTSIVGARFGMHAQCHSVLVRQHIFG